MKLFLSGLVWFVMGLAWAQPLDPDGLPGNWIGSGRFYNREFQDAFGSVGFELQIERDLTMSGTVGSAVLTPVKPRVEAGAVVYAATLRGEIRPGSAFQKDHMVLLLTATGPTRMTGDFHLKSNFVFDWSMRPGELVLTRKP